MLKPLRMMTRVRMEGKAVWRVNWGVWEVARGLGRGGRSHGLLVVCASRELGLGRGRRRKMIWGHWGDTCTPRGPCFVNRNSHHLRAAVGESIDLIP